jgi:hypothetical protein
MYPGRAPPIILVPADSRFDAGMTRRSGVRLPGGGHFDRQAAAASGRTRILSRGVRVPGIGLLPDAPAPWR